MRLVALAALTSVLLLLACGPAAREGAWAGAVDTTASGVVVVRNTGPGLWDSASAWRLDDELRIGSADESGPGAIMNPRTMEVDAAGRIYVVESQPNEVRVYAPDGRYLRTLMRTGSGPGEVRDAIGSAWDPAGHLWVVDQRSARYTLFDTSGARLAEHRRIVSGFFTSRWAGTITATGDILEITSPPGDAGSREVVVRLDSTMTPRDTLPLPRWRGPEYEMHREGVSSHIPVPFAPSLLWRLDPRGYLWHSITERYRIVQQSLRGDTVRVVEREADAVPVTAAEKDSGVARLRAFVQLGGIVDRSRIPDVKPPIERLWVDDRGYVWTQRSRAEGERGARLDVFDPDGRYLGEILSPLAFRTLLVRGAALYAIATDENDAPVVVCFRIRGR